MCNNKIIIDPSLFTWYYYYTCIFYTIHTDEWLVQKLVIMLIVALFCLLSSFAIVEFYTSNHERKVFLSTWKFWRKIFLIHWDSKLCISICPYRCLTCQMSKFHFVLHLNYYYCVRKQIFMLCWFAPFS